MNPVEPGGTCVDSSDCHGGSACVERVTGAMMTRKQCMTECNTTTTRLCMDGSVCRATLRSTGLPGPTVCYLGGTTEEGGTCVDSPECVQGAICVCDGAACSCQHACRVGDMTQGCDPGETCTAFGTGTDGYCTAAGIGQSCGSTPDCATGSSCFARAGATPAMQCMANCDRGMMRLCTDGSVCLSTSATTNAGICYLGGTIALGATCATNPDCVQGAVCVCTGPNCACAHACRVGEPQGCPDGFMCQAISTGTDGRCVMIPPPTP